MLGARAPGCLSPRRCCPASGWPGGGSAGLGHVWEQLCCCCADGSGEGGCLQPVLDVRGVPGRRRRLLRVVHHGDQVGPAPPCPAVPARPWPSPGERLRCPLPFPQSHCQQSLSIPDKIHAVRKFCVWPKGLGCSSEPRFRHSSIVMPQAAASAKNLLQVSNHRTGRTQPL